MNTFSVSEANDLYKLKEYCLHFDEINIYLDKLKFEGLVRHAVKYSNYVLKVGGRLTVHTSPFVSYHFRPGAIDFWQVKYEVFNALKDAIEIIEVSPKEGKLVLQKKIHAYHYTGISFGIVFSGNAAEEQQLISSINTIITNKEIDTVNYEILICGPTGYNPSPLINNFVTANIRYLPLDISTSPRLMICEKKNFLYHHAAFNLVVITHTRILFSENFIASILQSPVEMATPAIYYKEHDKQYKYLDFGFINSYQDIQFGAKRKTIAGENMDDDYLHWFRNRVPYIDGGLNVFNKNIIEYPPYNNYIAWGEAEDLDVCNRLFQQGVLIDYLPHIICYSATNKLKGYNHFFKIARKIFVWANKKRILH